MKDIEYIQGFRNNDERVISAFYAAQRESFFDFFRTHYSKDEAYILDLFQDSCIVLWKNIQHGKLTEEGLKSSLSTYFKSIGKYTMMAKDRKYKEIVNDDEIVKLKFVEEDAEVLQKRIERDDFIYRMVREMKPPCDRILIDYYWYKIPGTELASDVGFKNADSLKAQKFKCIKKLKPLIEKFMKL